MRAVTSDLASRDGSQLDDLWRSFQSPLGPRPPAAYTLDPADRSCDRWARIQLPTSWVSRLTDELDSEVVKRQAEASERWILLTKTIARLADERGKLLQASYASAIPLELLKTEQDRIGIAEHAVDDELQATEGDLEGWRTSSKRLSGWAAIATPRI